MLIQVIEFIYAWTILHLVQSNFDYNLPLVFLIQSHSVTDYSQIQLIKLGTNSALLNYDHSGRVAIRERIFRNVSQGLKRFINKEFL